MRFYVGRRRALVFQQSICGGKKAKSIYAEILKEHCKEVITNENRETIPNDKKRL